LSRSRPSAALVEALEPRAMLAGAAGIVDLNPGPADSSPSQFTRLGDQMLFSATTADGAAGWFVSDGTSKGTRRAPLDLAPEQRLTGYEPRQVQRIGSVAFFSSTVEGKQGLWRTDGTARGTKRLSANAIQGTFVVGEHF